MIASDIPPNEALVLAAAIPAVVAATVGIINLVLNGRRGRATVRKLDTGNEKDIGTTVHDIAQVTESLSGKLHEHDRKLDGLKAQLQDHIDDVDPLHTWVKAKMKETP